jgi:(p)ppGpp synthase/HD superfamily hydrolase
MTIEIKELEQFSRVVKNIMRVKDVIEVKRN